MSAMQRRMFTAAVLLAAAAALTACAGNAGTGGSDPDDPVGTWGDAKAAGEPSLVLASDGKLSGTDGCNQLSGAWTDDEDTITFDNVASTMMACEDVDTWLSKLSTGTVSGDTLTVYDTRGKEIGTLERGK
jgi:heat shock protein HslJ